MIIWINGAFGAGKTQSAYGLHKRLPNSCVFDPENAGFYLRKNLPSKIQEGDFQNYRMWREINYKMLSYIESQYDGVVIVPMTLVNPQYFSEIVGNLRQNGIPVHHFTLAASRETLLKRLRSRGEGGNSWAAKQIDRCIEGLSDERFKQHIKTDDMTLNEVIEEIAAQSGLKLLPDTRGPIGRLYDRISTQIRHIRFFN